MKNILTVFILGMLSFSSAFSSSSIESNDFLKSIAYDAKNEKGVMLNEWEPEGSSRSIIWSNDGMNWSGDGFIREAKIYLGNKGKITHKKDSGSNMDGYWYLTLKGDSNGLSMVKLKSNSATFDNPRVIDNSGFTKRMLCENKENLKTILYEISLPDKKPFWAKEFIKLTETGEGAGYVFTFGEQPSCSLWDMDQSEMKRKIEKCKRIAGSHISYKNLNHNTAIGACEIAIEISPKDKEIQYLLGRAYKKGGNNMKAVDWYSESSKNKYSDAQYALGTMYLKGIGIEKDPAKAYALYNDAAQGGNSEAYIAIGILHIKGELVEKNYDKAKSYFRKAIAEGNKKGEVYLRKLDALMEKEKKAKEKAKLETTGV